MDTPPKPSHLPEWASDELPLLTETVGEPPIPLLSDSLDEVPLLDEPLVEAPAQAPFSPAPRPIAVEPAAPMPAEPPRPSARPSNRAEPMAQIERELHAAAELIMQEVIDEYMLKIEAELHRRLEDHLASILRAGRR